jgi:hypothetical protein
MRALITEFRGSKNESNPLSFTLRLSIIKFWLKNTNTYLGLVNMQVLTRRART